MAIWVASWMVVLVMVPLVWLVFLVLVMFRKVILVWVVVIASSPSLGPVQCSTDNNNKEAGTVYLGQDYFVPVSRSFLPSYLQQEICER